MNLTQFATMTVLLCGMTVAADDSPDTHRLLYVAEPGIRNYLEYGGHGVLVYDIDDGHRFLRRIPMGGLNENGEPLNVKGVCASNETGRLYVSTIRHLMCMDLLTEEWLWEREYDGGCDRMSISPDGSHLYVPSFESDHWHVVDGATGDVIATITPMSRAHNTVYSPNRHECYLAGLASNLLTVADTETHTAARTVGPFSHSIRPFTINHDSSLVFANINECLGFEVGDLRTGGRLYRVDVEGYEQGPVKRHGCPSHGIAMTVDETEIWVCDAYNQRLHTFDATVMPPEQMLSIELRDEPGWITFSIDGTLAWPSTGEVIDVATHEIIHALSDEEGRMVMSEKLLEIDFENGVPVRAGNQFGIGGGWE